MEDKKHILAISAYIKNLAGDRILVVKRGEHEIAFPGKWAVPGGKLERGEKIADTLRREVMEEVGIDFKDGVEYLSDFTFVRPDGHNVVGLCFVVYAKSEDVELDKDFDDYKWVNTEELMGLDHIEGIEKEFKLALGK